MIKVAGLRSKLAIGLSSKVDGDPLAMLLFRVTESLRALVQVYPKLPSNFLSLYRYVLNSIKAF